MSWAHPDGAAPQVHGGGPAAPAALHLPAVWSGAAELPRRAAGAAGGQADAAARLPEVPVRSLPGDSGEPLRVSPAALGSGALTQGLLLLLLRCCCCCRLYTGLGLVIL